MQVLALDTASPLPSVTLYARGEAWEERLPDDRRSSEELLPAISRCRKEVKAHEARVKRNIVREPLILNPSEGVKD